MEEKKINLPFCSTWKSDVAEYSWSPGSSVWTFPDPVISQVRQQSQEERLFPCWQDQTEENISWCLPRFPGEAEAEGRLLMHLSPREGSQIKY